MRLILTLLTTIFCTMETLAMETRPLKYWFWWPIRTYDTFEADTPPVMQLGRNIYATLVSEFIDGKVEGILAKEWRISTDGKTWRFKLRTDLKFDNGDAITPEIVLQSFKRILWLTREEGLVLNSLLPEISQWKSMHEKSRVIFLENKDELVFVFNKRPVALFEAISQPIYGLAHPSCYDKDGKWKDTLKTVASGQYSIAKRGENFIQLKSRHVFNEVEAAPDVAEIHWPSVQGDSVVKAIEEKRGDLTVEHSFALGNSARAKLESAGVKSVQEPAVRMHFVHLNHKRGAYTNKNLRQKVRDLFLNKLSADKNFSSAGSDVDPSFIPKGGVGYKKFAIPNSIQAVSKPTGEKVEVLFYPFSADPLIQGSVEKALLESLKESGVDAKITRYNERFEAFNRMRNGDFDVIVRGTGILVNNPYGDLRMMFMSKVGARIPDPTGRVPRMIEAAEIEPEDGKRSAIVGDINSSIFDEASIITFAHSGLFYLSHGKIDFSRYNFWSDPIEFRAVGWRPNLK